MPDIPVGACVRIESPENPRNVFKGLSGTVESTSLHWPEAKGAKGSRPPKRWLVWVRFDRGEILECKGKQYPIGGICLAQMDSELKILRD